MKQYNRRNFLHFLGRAGLVSIGAGVLPAVHLTGCSPKVVNNPDRTSMQKEAIQFALKALQADSTDKLSLAEGLDFKILAKWTDAISDKDTFGTHADYVAFLPFDKEKNDDGLLWVNHEYTSRLFVSGYSDGMERTKEQVEKEQYSVGGSIVRIKKDENGQWQIVKNDKYNRRLTAKTEIPFNWDEPIMGKKVAIGTFANCAGGVTPWGTVLTCEENYDHYYGETDYSDPKNPKHIPGGYGWKEYFDYPPEHYGWVVEVDLKTGEAQKHIALGRCAHECATVHQTKDGRVVVYTGDDANDECLYKFISKNPKDLKEGTLYVANTEKGEWISLDINEQPVLKEHFDSQTDVLIRLREAAKLVGGTPLDRPEDIEIDPVTGNVLVALTNNVPKGNHYGSILKLVEDDADKLSLTFKSETFLAGGEETGFACPDNMAFDPKGNLWFTSDISGSKINNDTYKVFQHNGLYFVPMSGEDAGKVFQIASAPVDAEFTGPCFTADGSTLFLCVQHPGEGSKSKTELTSNWPEGGSSIPKSAVVAISGELLERYCGVEV